MVPWVHASMPQTGSIAYQSLLQGSRQWPTRMRTTLLGVGGRPISSRMRCGLIIITLPPAGERSLWWAGLCVGVFVCLRAYIIIVLFQLNQATWPIHKHTKTYRQTDRISKKRTTKHVSKSHKNADGLTHLRQNCLLFIYGRSAVLLWRRCDMSCTSGLMDDAMFAHNGHQRNRRREWRIVSHGGRRIVWFTGGSTGSGTE